VASSCTTAAAAAASVAALLLWCSCSSMSSAARHSCVRALQQCRAVSAGARARRVRERALVLAPRACVKARCNRR
jgi:hypothetical protein